MDFANHQMHYSPRPTAMQDEAFMFWDRDTLVPLTYRDRSYQTYGLDDFQPYYAAETAISEAVVATWPAYPLDLANIPASRLPDSYHHPLIHDHIDPDLFYMTEPSYSPPLPPQEAASPVEPQSLSVAQVATPQPIAAPQRAAQPHHHLPLASSPPDPARSPPGSRPGAVPLSRSASDISGKKKGRKQGLSPEGRRDAHLMRKLGACRSCRIGKRKCDAGIPCRACILYHKSNLCLHPCRGRALEGLSSLLLSDSLAWHPAARSLDAFLTGYAISGAETTLPIRFGFGLPLLRSVVFVHPVDPNELRHRHVVYTWPPRYQMLSERASCSHVVFPALLSRTYDLADALDHHLSVLVDHHFEDFPSFQSPLEVLRRIYSHYKRTAVEAQSRLLHLSLKLLVLVHASSAITVPGYTETPCFIRAQFGTVVPSLARGYLTEILSTLERQAPSRACATWPTIFSSIALLLMAVESAQYQGARLGYHCLQDRSSVGGDERCETARLPDGGVGCGPGVPSPSDDAVEDLLHFYRVCYSGCHARLQADTTSPAPTRGSTDPGFVAGMRSAVLRARPYLLEKQRPAEQREEERAEGGEDLGGFFDRLLARLFLGKVD